MQLLADYLPLILFFVAFKWQGIYVATAVAIVASVVQIAWLRLVRGRVEVVHWLSLAIIVLFGGATLALQDDTFIRWKPTVLYGLFAAILGVGKFAFGRNLIAYLIKGVTLPDFVWTRLTWAWTVFLAFMAVANLYVAYRYPLDVWVDFKVWGGIGLALAFALVQGFWLSRYLAEEKA